MWKQFINVIKIVRPKHLFKATLHPLREIEAFKYHYRRVREEEFVLFLSELPKGEKHRQQLVYADFFRHTSFLESLRGKLSTHTDNYGGQMTKEATAVYALIRLLQPERIVETGVADGTTSSIMLRALEDNQKGKLYSIDVPSELLPQGKTSGWIVPDDLRQRWDLRIGPSSALLKPLLLELGWIDWFLHDSLHTYDNMMFEFRIAWPYLRSGGLFLSHDIGRNSAFFDFAKEVGVSWRHWRVYHVLGGFRVHR